LCRAQCFRLVCDPFSGNECWDIYKFDTNERVGVFLARRILFYFTNVWLSKVSLLFFVKHNFTISESSLFEWNT
jgi:hypothetical protein